MSVVILSIIPAFASVSDNTDNIYKYYLVLSDNRYIVSADPLYVEHRGDYYYFSSSSAYKFFTSDDELFAFSETAKSYIFSVSDNSYLKRSNYDVKFFNSDDVFFYPPTILEQLLNLVPQGVGAKMAEDSLTLTICGISLLALLVGCSLVPKVLYRFL